MNTLTRYSALIWFGLLMLGLAVGIIFELSFFSGKLQEIGVQEADLRAKIATLTNRKNALAALTPEVVAQSAKSVVALPAENSAILVAAQIRQSASDHGVNLNNLTIGTYDDPTRPDFGNVQVGIIAEGSSPSILAFVGELPKLSPLLLVDTVNLTTNATSTLAQITVRSFWSPLPSTLPPLTEPLEALTPEESELLSKLAEYKSPTFNLNEESSSSGAVNTNPFGVLNN